MQCHFLDLPLQHMDVVTMEQVSEDKHVHDAESDSTSTDDEIELNGFRRIEVSDDEDDTDDVEPEMENSYDGYAQLHVMTQEADQSGAFDADNSYIAINMLAMMEAEYAACVAQKPIDDSWVQESRALENETLAQEGLEENQGAENENFEGDDCSHFEHHEQSTIIEKRRDIELTEEKIATIKALTASFNLKLNAQLKS